MSFRNCRERINFTETSLIVGREPGLTPTKEFTDVLDLPTKTLGGHRRGPCVNGKTRSVRILSVVTEG